MKFLQSLFSAVMSPPKKTAVPDGLKKVIDRYGDAAVVTAYDSIDPTILYANKRHKKLTGYSTEEIAGKTPRVFQGKNTSAKTKREMRDDLKRSSFWHGEVINYRKNGEEIHVNVVIFAICYEGKKYYIALKKLTSEN